MLDDKCYEEKKAEQDQEDWEGLGLGTAGSRRAALNRAGLHGGTAYNSLVILTSIFFPSGCICIPIYSFSLN